MLDVLQTNEELSISYNVIVNLNKWVQPQNDDIFSSMKFNLYFTTIRKCY